MAGHSKWKNIQHRKNAQDAKRGKLFMKLSKELHVAAKEGGGDPETNPNLRLVIEKARNANMPNDNIDRAIKKATGDLEGVHYEEITYEGYGPGGIAVMVKVLTDNKNRSASEVRHLFTKHDGNLGENGCVAFMFQRKGLLTVERNNPENDEDFMLEAIEAGAEDIQAEDEVYEIYTDPEDFSVVKENLAENYTFSTAEVTMIPDTTTKLETDEAVQVLKLIDALEDNDDVQEVYHNLEADDEVYEQYES
ncbi:MAG TPA: YebC/PmpR family DNA-binding transcriptional regulator [Bacillales bacterium]|nr:YebC/PmpR family DNA-binding transcriptional regulator [Bacillales bacterium]